MYEHLFFTLDKEGQGDGYHGYQRTEVEQARAVLIAVHGYQGKFTVWTLRGPHLDLTERFVEECRHTIGV